MKHEIDKEAAEQVATLMRTMFTGVLAMVETAAGTEPDEKASVSDRYTDAVATLAAKQRDAFKNKGFSQEEAVQLVGCQLAQFAGFTKSQS